MLSGQGAHRLSPSQVVPELVTSFSKVSCDAGMDLRGSFLEITCWQQL